LTDVAPTYGAELARSKDRAASIWGMGLTAFAASGGDIAVVLSCLTLPFAPSAIGMWRRIILILLAGFALALGPSALVVTTPAALALIGFPVAASRALFALMAFTLSAHHLENLPSVTWLSIHPGSTGFILMPTLVTIVVMGRVVGWRAVAALTLGAAASFTLIELGAARWINYTIFTDPVFRLVVALVPMGIASFFVSSQVNATVRWRGLVLGAAVGALIALILPTKPTSSIIFDEAHGTWETVQSSFEPDDFGRVANYTYSLLFKYAAQTVGSTSILETEADSLPQGGIFVLKMPTQPLSDAFADRLEVWVRDGGRLLVIADHTDLYDTSQYLNSFLTPRFGLKLNSDAVYNSIGLPTVPITERFAALFGRIDAHGRPLPWMTGASLGSMPANAIRLATFGPSFSEPGDYSRQNRFGPFIPRVSLRFTDHSAVAAFGVGRGAIAIILDSTPWSNFSQFKEQYLHLFRAIVHALERPLAIQVLGWGAIALTVMAVATALWCHPIFLVAGGFVLGLTLTSSAQIGLASFSTPVEGRDYGLRVVSGASARFEFLGQLVGPGERNYARVVSAMAKYDLDPMASTPGSEVPNLLNSRRWLLIEPDPEQLPAFENLIRHMRRGGDIAILFAPDQAASPKVRQWLASLGLYAQRAIGLAVAEDAKPGLLNRKGASLLRDARAVTGVQPTSLLKDREFDVLLQSYTVRPTKFPRTGGLLIVGFSADQFSDDAVGEVWEGVQPSALGRHRERQLAAALMGKNFLFPFPDNLTLPPTGAVPKVSLPAYAVFENGKAVLSGRFGILPMGPLSPLENPVRYLSELRDGALAFIASSCPKVSEKTKCKQRLLGLDAIEWMVTWAADDKGQITAVELLHERRFSGMGSVVNVVFAQ